MDIYYGMRNGPDKYEDVKPVAYPERHLPFVDWSPYAASDHSARDIERQCTFSPRFRRASLIRPPHQRVLRGLLPDHQGLPKLDHLPDHMAARSSRGLRAARSSRRASRTGSLPPRRIRDFRTPRCAGGHVSILCQLADASADKEQPGARVERRPWYSAPASRN